MDEKERIFLKKFEGAETALQLISLLNESRVTAGWPFFGRLREKLLGLAANFDESVEVYLWLQQWGNKEDQRKALAKIFIFIEDANDAAELMKIYRLVLGDEVSKKLYERRMTWRLLDLGSGPSYLFWLLWESPAGSFLEQQVLERYARVDKKGFVKRRIGDG